MSRRLLPLLVLPLLLLASCSTTPDYSVPMQPFTTAPAGTRPVDSGSGWTFDIDDAHECMWVHGDGISHICLSTHQGVGDIVTQMFQDGDVQMVLVLLGSKEPLVAWWSTSARRDRIPMVEVQPDVWAAASPRATGETVWGVQARTADGTVQHVISVPQNVGIQR